MKVGFISLGCSKNLIDTEMTIGLFKQKAYEIVNDPKVADIIVINTCGFIEPAKQEAIDTILEMAQYKKQKCKYLIVMGCLVQRYKEDLEKSIPEVDLFIKYDEYEKIWGKIEKLISSNDNKEYSKLDFMNRVITTGENYAYLRIAEGCSNRCTYCAIPYIRGPFVSRKIEEIIAEAKQLAQKGYKEIIVIAQDTTKYGIDIYGETRLTELLRKITKIEGIEWVRFLYAYPETITDELIQEVKQNPKICKYFDIPIQHISDTVLKRMNRKSNGESIRKLLSKIKKEIPEAVLRTSLIVGFPGETKENFEELYKFVEETKFDKLGVFQYSKEDGTPAEKLSEQVHPATKKSRHNKIMELQQKISEQNLQQKIGKEYKVLIENKSFDGKYYVGRTYMDVPDMDGVVYIKNTKEGLNGKIVKCEITNIQEYDLIGKLK